jgi:uncharacterized phage-associated protein
MYRATDIAKWFINRGLSEGKALTPMQVLKLTYIAQGIHLAAYDEGLFLESCEAWAYGPVVKAVYQKTKPYGQLPITQDPFPGSKGINPQDHQTLSALNAVWGKFGHMSGIELSNWSHRPGSAWDIAFNQENGKAFIGYDISADLLKREFEPIVKQKLVRKTRPGWN